MNESNDAQDINEQEIKEEERNKKKQKKKEKKKDEDKEEEEEEENFAVIPPNGGWGWLVVFCAFYCNVVVDGIQLTFGIFLKAISTEFKADYSVVALAGSLMFGTHLLMGPVCSGCNSAFGLRPVTITGSLICCFGVGISYFANGFWYLFFSFGIIGGMGLGLVYMNTLVITSLYFDTLLPIAIAIVVCGTGIGTMVFAGLGSFLLGRTTWRNSFLMQAALACSMGIAAITFRPLKRVKVKIIKEEKLSSDVPQKIDEEEEEEEEEEEDEEEEEEEERQQRGEPSSKRRSVFIKTDINRGSTVSFRTYQNLALSFAEAEAEKHFLRKNRCPCLRCCKKRKRVREEVNVLLLQEIQTDDPKSRRKSFVETTRMLDTEEEEEIPATERQQSTISHNVVYTRVEIKEKKNKHWNTLRKTLVAMLDYRLLTSCSFFIFTVSGATSLAGFLIVFIYEKDRCEDLGFSEQVSDSFIIVLGAFSVFWRLVLGAIAIIPKTRHWALTISGMVIGGIATLVSGYCSSIYFQIAFCCLFCLGMASFAVFRMPLVIDLVGMDFLENAAGINLLFMGLFCIMLPPIFGWVREATNSYNVVFTINGSLIVISALMLIRLKKVDVTKIKKKNILANS